MSQQQNQELTYKEKFNIAYSLCLYHQRCIVIICRHRFGKNAIAFPCAFALVLMLLWWLATHDHFMLAWIVIWVGFQLKRRIESIRLHGQVHSYYDGWPFDAIRYCQSEKTAKLVVEPVLTGMLGAFLFWVYTENGWHLTGLPYFLLAGVFTLPLVELVKQAAWQRRLEAMNDAKRESEMAIRDYQDQFGN